MESVDRCSRRDAEAKFDATGDVVAMTTIQSSTVDGVDDPQEVLGLLREQDSLYAKLETFADRQRDLVTADDVGPLLMVLADRQRLAGELAEISRRLGPVRRRWSTYRTSLTQPQLDEAERLLDGVADRLNRVISCDEHDARVLSVRRQAVARALQVNHSTGQAMQAYQQNAKRSGRLDCTDEVQ